MNKLTTSKRAQILGMLVEGMSMRAITRITGVSINTVAKLLNDAGNACAAYHDEHVRGIRGHRRIECDEIWSFVYAKERAVSRAKAAPDGAGDTWTFTAVDADSKLITSYLVSGERDGESALAFMDDLRGRLEDRPQVTTDGLIAYVGAVEGAFGGDVDFAQVIKEYGKEPGEDNERRYSPPVCTNMEKRRIEGNPDLRTANTSYVERHNLSMRMGMRRFTRLTNAFSKKVEKHVAMLSLYFVHYNFCRIHKTLRVTPAMEAGIETTVRDYEWIVGLIDAMAPAPKRPGPKPGARYAKRAKSNWYTTYIGTRPSKASVRSICRKISELTEPRFGLLEQEVVVKRLNRLMLGWSNYFILGQVRPAYAAIDRHALKRLLQWRCRKHKAETRNPVRLGYERLWTKHGLIRLGPRTTRFPWAKA